MKKINPKVTRIVMLLMSMLLAGGALVIKEGLGDVSNGPTAGDQDGKGMW